MNTGGPSEWWVVKQALGEGDALGGKFAALMKTKHGHSAPETTSHYVWLARELMNQQLEENAL